MSLLLAIAILGWVLCATSIAIGFFNLHAAKRNMDELHKRYDYGMSRCVSDVAKWKTKALLYEKLAVEQGLKESKGENDEQTT